MPRVADAPPARPFPVTSNGAARIPLDSSTIATAITESSPWKWKESTAFDVDIALQSPDGGVQIILPSQTSDPEVARSIVGLQLYEERSLWNLVSAGPAKESRPPIRQVMLLSQPFDATTMEYLLQLLGGIPGSEAKDRLTLFLKSPETAIGLSTELLAKPDVLERVRQMVGQGDPAHLICFMSTDDEKRIAQLLGVELRANDPERDYWGSKPGGREVFKEAGVPHPDGTPRVHNPRELATELAALIERYPEDKKVVVKLSQGTSGNGNALLDLEPLKKEPLKSGEELASRLEKMLPDMRLQGAEMTWPLFVSKMEEIGAIAERFVEGDTKASPSVQGRILPDGKVEVISTHEQLLGGEDEQTYLGARFPAEERYRKELQEYGAKVGQVLSEKGAMGRFAVDFMAIEKEDGGWDLQAIEINLREGGTTHPFEIMRVLTGGSMDETTGEFHVPNGTAKSYVVSDNMKADRYRGLTPGDAADIAHRYGLHYDPETQTGIAFHMLSLLWNHGKVGVTCIADSAEEAKQLFDSTEKALDQEISRATSRAENQAPQKLPDSPAPDKTLKSPPTFLVGDQQQRMRPRDGVFSDWIRAVSFAPDQPLLATAVNNRGSFAVRVHNRRSGEQLQSLEGPTMPVRDVAFGRKDLVTAGAADGTVHAWNAVTGATLWTWRQPGMVNSVAASDDGNRVAAGDTSGQLCVWDVGSGEELFKLRGRDGWIRSVAFSPDGGAVAAGYADGVVKIFNLESGEELASLEGHNGGVYGLSFSDDGRLVAATSGDGSVAVWHARDKKLLHLLEREWRTGTVSFAPGGSRLAFGSSDGTVRLYDWKSGDETSIRNFDSHPTALQQEFQRGPVFWSESGRTLSSLSADGSLREWTFA